MRHADLLQNAALALSATTAALYLAAAVTWLYFANSALSMMLFLCALPAIVLSATVSCAGAAVTKGTLRSNVVRCIWPLVMPLAWLVIVLPTNRYLERLRHTQTKATFNRLITDIEAVRLRIGRLPANEAELSELLGRCLPLSAWGDPINYRLVGSSAIHYRISCLTGDFAGTIYRYDSRNRIDKVIVEPF